MMKIEFYTDDARALEYPPIPAKKLIPDWYKDMNEHVFDSRYKDDMKFQIMNEFTNGIGTVKTCVPVRDYMTSGYIIRANVQSLITPEVTSDGSKIFWAKHAGGPLKIEQHSHMQCPIKVNGYNNVYMKYPNSWRIRVPKGYSCLFYQPKFFFEERYSLFPGIVDCDDYEGEAINFPGVINTDKSFYIEPGDPIMAVFPFRRDDWESVVRPMTEAEWKKPSAVRTFLHSGYKRLFHKKKKYR